MSAFLFFLVELFNAKKSRFKLTFEIQSTVSLRVVVDILLWRWCYKEHGLMVGVNDLKGLFQ